MRYKLFIGLFIGIGLLVMANGFPVSSQEAIPTKQIAAPPSDFADVQLPSPETNGVRSRSAMVPVTLRQDGAEWVWKEDVIVDGRSELSLMLLAPDAEAWQLSVQTPGKKAVALTSKFTEMDVAQRTASVGVGDNQFEGQLYSVAEPNAGKWSVQITTEAAPVAAKEVDGYLVVSSDSSYQLYSHLSSYDLLAGNEIGLVTQVYDDARSNGTAVPTAVNGAIQEATLNVTTPAGETVAIPMADDGRHGDGEANDGVFGGTLTAADAGEYSAQIVVEGVDPDGTAFMRTSEHVFPVVEQTMVLRRFPVRARQVDDGRLQLNLWGRALTNSIGDVLAFAEVWGTDANGDAVPVAWIGGQVTPEMRRNWVSIPLMLDTGWLDLAGAQAPFELRNVRVQDVETAVPVAQLDAVQARIRIRETSSTNDIQRAAETAVTEEMLMGPRPAAPAGPRPLAPGDNVLMLVHGYCSGGNTWPTSHFTDYAVFSDPNQNRTHDQFAQLIDSFGNQFDSFGIVAHSQGGAAALHLYTYYWSGLDYSSGNRLIQTVGTPYQGTALAGSLAAIGDVFGAGCGTNWDLTYDGAALWLSGIPSWARSRVYYHTTSFTDKWWRYDYCNFATDLFLSDPDDGVIEKWAGQLSGANNMGHKTGWCHTTNMRDPGQVTDYSRNVNMNANANR
jgi:hypothetical protein